MVCKFAEKVNEGLRKIAHTCQVEEWELEFQGMEKILRRLGDNLFIREPNYNQGKDWNEEVDLEDERLRDALAYFILAGAEPQRGNYYMANFYNLCENYGWARLESVEPDRGEELRYAQVP